MAIRRGINKYTNLPGGSSGNANIEYTPDPGELVVDLTDYSLWVGDGNTPGGLPLVSGIRANVRAAGDNGQIQFNRNGYLAASSGLTFNNGTLITSTVAAATGSFAVVATAGNVSAGGNVSANYFIGNGALLTGLSDIYSNSNVANFLGSNSNITVSVGTGNITTQGNVTANYFLGNISQAQGYFTYGNSNVANYLPTYNGNLSPGNIAVAAALAANVITAANITLAVGNLHVTGGNDGYFLRTDGQGMLSWSATGPASGGNVTVSGASGAIQFINAAGNNLGSDPGLNYNSLSGTLNAPLILATSNITTTLGNIQGQFILGNGRFLTGLPEGYSNNDVANYLGSNSNIEITVGTGNITTQGDITTQGNIAAGNISVGNIAAGNIGSFINYPNGNYQTSTTTFRGNGIFANLIPAPLEVYGNGVGAVWPDLGSISNPWNAVFSLNDVSIGGATGVSISSDTGVATFTDPSTAGAAGISAGDITSDVITANSAVLASVLRAGSIITGNIISNANVEATYFLGNGAFLTGLPEAYGNSNVANFLVSYAGNISASNLTVANNAVILGNLRVQGNTTFVNTDDLNVSNLTITLAANATQPSDANGAGILIAGANVSWLYSSVSNSMSLSHLLSVPVLNAATITAGTVTANLQAATATVSGVVTADSVSANSISVGNISLGNILGNATVTGNVSAGNITTAGNVTAGYFLGNIRGATGGYSNANVADYLPAYTGNLVSLTGNVITTANISANHLVRGDSRVSFNIDAADNLYLTAVTDDSTAVFITTDTIEMYAANGVSVSANIGSNTVSWLFQDSGELVAPGNIISNANITADYFLGNGAFLTGLPEAYGNANVANYLQVLTSNITTTANIRAGNIAATSNILGQNLVGLNVFTDNLLRSNGQPYDFAGTYSNANVANYLPTYGGNVLVSNLIIGSNVQNVAFLGYESATFTGNVTADRGIFTGISGEIITANQPGITGLGTLGNLTVSGNITAGNIRGSLIGSVTGNVTGNTTGTHIGPVVGNVTGNVTGSVTGNTTGTHIGPVVGNVTGAVANITDIIAANIVAANAVITSITGNIITANQPGITGLGTLGNLTVSGNITAAGGNLRAGNVFANYYYPNGAALVASYGNANVAAYLQVYAGPANLGAVTISNANVTVTAASIPVSIGTLTSFGGGSWQVQVTDPTGRILNAAKILGLTSVSGDNPGTVTSVTNSAGFVYDVDFTTRYTDIVSIGTAVFVYGDRGVIFQDQSFQTTAFLGYYDANFRGNLSAQTLRTDNIQYANGAPWNFGSTYGNANVANYLPTYTGNLDSLTGNVTTTANITANYFLGNGALLTGLAATYGNANVADYLASNANINIELQGNITANNSNVAGSSRIGNVSMVYNNARNSLDFIFG